MDGLRFCSHCKSHLEQAEKILYADDSYRRGFCSEACIADYFGPLCDHFQKIEEAWRKKHGVEKEPCLALLDEPLPEVVLEDPDEIYSFPAETYETLHGVIKTIETESFGPVYYLGLGMILENQFSFLFLLTCPGSEGLAGELRSSDWKTFEDRSGRRQ